MKFHQKFNIGIKKFSLPLQKGVFWYIFIAILYPTWYSSYHCCLTKSYTIPHGTLFCTIIHLIIYPCSRGRLPRPYCSVSTSYKNFSFFRNCSISFFTSCHKNLHMSHIHSTCTTLFKTFILKVIQAKNIAIRYDASRYMEKIMEWYFIIILQFRSSWNRR